MSPCSHLGLQTIGIYCQITGVSIIMIYMFANKWTPESQWYNHENKLEECLKGHDIYSILKVVSIYLFLYTNIVQVMFMHVLLNYE